MTLPPFSGVIVRHGKVAEGRQNLTEIRSGLVNAKRLGVRQPSGALERGHCQFPVVPAGLQCFTVSGQQL